MAQFNTNSTLIDLSNEDFGVELQSATQIKQEVQEFPKYSGTTVSDAVAGASSSINSSPSTNGSIHARVRLPNFWKHEPELWFVHVEALFFANNIRSDEERYYTVLSALDSPEVLNQVTDFLRSPPQQDKYKSFKLTIISRFSDSSERQLNKLLTELSLEDKKPSQLLREMLKLAPNNTPESVIHSLWFQRMPTSVRCILSASQGVNLLKLAEIADRIIEHSSVSAPVEVNPSPSTLNSIQHQLGNLEQRLDKLTIALKNDQAMTHSSRTSSKYHKRDRSSSRLDTLRDVNRKVCFFHRRFAEKARKCIAPCDFTSTNNQGN